MAAMLILGFASGLPLMMVFQKLSIWLREAGVDRTTIGQFYWVSLAYSLKFLWSPAVDRLSIPVLQRWLGRRRAWMITAIGGTIAGMLLIGSSDPSESLAMTIAGALLLAYAGATLDVAIDGWRIESAPNTEQANMAAVYTLGYRFAIMFSGIGLIIADNAGWSAAFAAMATAMGISAALVLLMREPPRPEGVAKPGDDASPRALTMVQRARAVGDAVVLPFQQIFHRLGPWMAPVLAMVALYRMSDFTMGVMAGPLYVDAGYAKTTIGVIQSGFGPWVTIFGGFIGGLAVWRMGIMRALIAGAALTFVTNAAYAVLASATSADANAVAVFAARATPFMSDAMAAVVVADRPVPSAWMLFLAIAGDNIAAGFVTTVFIAYMSSLTDPAFAATQYAVFASLYAVLPKFMAGFSGVLADAVGYPVFFVATAGWAIPAGILAAVILIRGPPQARGIRPQE